MQCEIIGESVQGFSEIGMSQTGFRRRGGPDIQLQMQNAQTLHYSRHDESKNLRSVTTAVGYILEPRAKRNDQIITIARRDADEDPGP